LLVFSFGFRMYIHEVIGAMIARRMITLTSMLAAVVLVIGCGPADRDDVVLRDDGLAIVTFGDGVEPAVAVLTEALGQPSIDELITPASENQPCTEATGYKCVGYLRRVVWDRWGLAVVFSDVKGYTRGLSPIVIAPHFVVWEHWQPPTERAFTTESGIGPGSTMGDLRAAYAEDLVDMSIGCSEGNGWVDQDVIAIGNVSSGPHIAPGNDMTRDLPLDAATEKTDAARQIAFMWAGFHKDCRPGHPYLSPGPDSIN
jgi:hypothetical protein